MTPTQSLTEVITQDESALLAEWLRLQLAATTLKRELLDERDCAISRAGSWAF
jgi:hypothetical protein